MIYAHKPQRSGRSISSNTNNPPQDPPPPPENIISDDIPKISEPIIEIPDIPISDTTPTVPETCMEEKLPLSQPIKSKPTIKIVPKTIPKPIKSKPTIKIVPKTIPKPIKSKPTIKIVPKTIPKKKRFSFLYGIIARIQSFFRRNN